MGQNTPYLNLYKPGGGSSGLNTPDEVMDVDRFNANSDLIDAFASSIDPTSRNQQFTGLASAIGAVVGPKLGDEYQETDGNKRLWRYDGANWVGNESGLLRIRPASVNGTGISITPSGSVLYDNAAVGGRVNIEGVFDFNKYKRYRIHHTFRKSGPTALAGFIFRGAGVDRVSAAYFVVQNQVINGAFTTISSTAATSIGNALDALGAVVTVFLDVTMVDTKQVLAMQGTVMGRYGGMDSKTVFLDYEGPDTAGIDGLGITYGQSAHGEWSFYAYLD
jgi:hypothetical protein